MSENNEEVFEEGGNYSAEVLIKEDLARRISKTELRLKESEVFEPLGFLKRITPFRKNEVHCGVSLKEFPIDIKHTSGIVNIPLITREDIYEKMKKIPIEERRKLGYIHIGGIKILIKSTYRQGINSPIKIVILDNRITNRKDAVIGSFQGNLAYGKLIFSVYPKIGLPLETKNVNKAICLAHVFERNDLMESGDMPFTITYLVGYSLSNSHHSMSFKNRETIEIDDLFQPVGRVYQEPFQLLDSIKENWTMDLTPKPLLHRHSVSGRLTITDQASSSSSTNNDLREDIIGLSKKISEFEDILNNV